MAKFLIISPKHVKRFKLAAGLILLAGTAFFFWHNSTAQSTLGSSGTQKARTIHMITGEFSSKGPDGKEIESYLWHPGTIYAEQGETIELKIYGVNGESHPFVIDGLGVKGEVKKGQETTVTFEADKPGIYRILCLLHPDKEHNGPMVGYLVIED